MKKIKDSFVILNDKGLHTRPSTELVKCAAHFTSNIQLTHKKCVVNAKSILGILMLTAEKGARITVEAEGADADKAVAAIVALAKKRFNIDY
jgi:phosphocarrier protein HPr